MELIAGDVEGFHLGALYAFQAGLGSGCAD
jgi:hypothetical protein